MSGFDDDDDEDRVGPIKVCLLGPSRTGKTCLRRAWEKQSFESDCAPTQDLKSSSIIEWRTFDGDRDVVKRVEVWDTPGSRKAPAFKQIGNLLHECHGVVFVLDLTRSSSLLKMEAYWHHVMDWNPQVATILVGNKGDDLVNREIEKEEAKALAEKLCCEGYFEVSAKTNKGLKQALDCLAATSMDVELAETPTSKQSRSRRLSVFTTPAPTGGDEMNSLISPQVTRNFRYKSEKYVPKRVDVGQWYIPLGERDAFLHSFRETLRKGVTVLLYPHGGGAPDYAKLTLHKSNKRLSWENITSSRSVLDGLVINDIAEIRPHTHFSYTFRQMRIPKSCEGIDHLFTLVSSKKSISMAADTPENCIFLVKGLKLLVEKAIPSHIKRKRGKEPFSEAKLLLLKNGKKKNSKFKELKSKLELGMDVISITKGINQREVFMYLNSSQTRLIFSRRQKRGAASRSSIIDSFFLYFEGPDPGIDIDDISEIRPGYSLDSLDCKPPPHPSQEQLAISVIGSEHTVSILMPSTSERDYYVEKLQAWIKAVRPSVSVY